MFYGCLLFGIFFIGQWAVTFFGLSINKDAAGLIAVMGFIWVYEHDYFERKIERKYERLLDIL
ncbi:MAG: hypothetical protein WA728_29095, partial [Xanthobacteraceae bacterium]